MGEQYNAGNLNATFTMEDKSGNTVQNVSKNLQAVIKTITDMNRAGTASAKAMMDMNSGMMTITSTEKGLSTQTKQTTSDLFQTSIAVGAMGASILALTREVGQFAFSYDRNMTMVKAVTGATGDELNTLAKATRDLGVQSEYGATKAAEAMLVLSRMGLKAAESMQVLEPSMKLAQSQQQDLATTTELVVNQLRVFGASMSEADKYANVMAATSSKTAADLEKLNLSLSYAGPIAKTAGISFEEVNATLGIMFNNGIKASRAGTSLRFALAAMVGATSKSEKALKGIGLSMKDVDISARPLGDIFRTLADSIGKTDNKAKALFDIFGKRAAPAMATVLNTIMKNEFAFDDLRESITDTDEVQRQFDIQMKSFSGQVLLIKSNIEELALGFSDSLAPAMMLVTKTFLGTIKIIQALPEPIKAVIGSLIITTGVAATLVASFAMMRLTTMLVGKELGFLTKGFLASAGVMKVMVVSNLQYITSLTGMRVALMNLGAAAKTAFALMGGWVTIAIAAVALLGLAVYKEHKAHLDAIKSAEDHAMALGKLTKEVSVSKSSVDKLTEELNRLKKAGKDTKDVELELESAQRKLHKSNVKLMEDTDVMVTGFNAVTGEITFQAEQLKSLTANYDSLVEARKKAKALDESSAPGGAGAYDREVRHQGAVNRIQDITDINLLNAELKKTLELAEGSKVVVEGLYQEIADGAKISTSKAAEIAGVFTNNTDEIDHFYKKAKGLGVLWKDLDNEAKLPFAEQTFQSMELLQVQMGQVGITSGEQIKETRNLLEGLSRPLAREMDILNKKNELAYALAKRIKELKVGEIKVKDPDEEEGGSGTTKSTLHFDALLKRMEAFKVSLQQVTKDTFWQRGVDDMTEYEVGLAKIEKDYSDKMASMAVQTEILEASIEESRTKRSEAFAKGNNVDAAQWQKVLDRQLKLKEQSDGDIVRAEESLGQRKNEVREKYENDFNTKLIEDSRDQARASRIAADELIEIQNKTVKSIEDKYVDLYQTIIEEEKNKNKEIDNVGGSEEAVSEAKWANGVATSNKLAALELARVTERISYEKKILELKIATIKDTEDLELKKLIKIKKATEESMKDIANIKAKPSNKVASAKLKEAEEETEEKVKLTEEEITEAVTGIVKSLFGMIKQITTKAVKANQSTIQKGIQAVYDSWTEGILGGFAQMASGNYVGGLISAVSSVTDVIGYLGSYTEMLKVDEREKRDARNAAIDKVALNTSRTTHAIETSNMLLGQLVRAATGTDVSQEDSLINIGDLFKKAFDKAMETAGAKGYTKTSKLSLAQYEEAMSDLPDKLKTSLDYYGLDLESMTSKEFTNLFNNLNDIKAMGDTGKVTGYTEGSVIDYQYTTNQLIEKGILAEGSTETNVILSDLSKAMIDLGSKVNLSNFADSALSSDELLAALKSKIQYDKLSVANQELNTSIVSGKSDGAALKGFQDSYKALLDPVLLEVQDAKDDQAARIAQVENILKSYVKTLAKAEAEGRDTTSIKSQIAKYEQEKIDLNNNDVLSSFSSKTGDFDQIKKVLDNILALSVDKATTEGEIKSAYDYYEQQLKQLVNFTKDQLSIDEQAALSEDISKDKPKEMAEAIANLKDGVNNPTLDAYKDASSGIITAFNKGAITFEQAMTATNNMAGKIGDVPEALRKDFQTLIRQLKISLMTTQKAKGQAGADLIETAESGSESYKGTLADLAKEKNDVINSWTDLIDLQSKLENNLTDEVLDAKAASKEKIDNLTKERDLLIGNFNFNETQNQRSKRFQAIRGKEASIMEETMALSEKLSELYAKNATDLEEVNLKLQELADKYGDISKVADYFQDKMDKATTAWKNQLTEISDKYSEITGKIMDLTGAMEGNFSDWWTPFKLDIDKFINDLASQVGELDGLELKEKNNIAETVLGQTEVSENEEGGWGTPTDTQEGTKNVFDKASVGANNSGGMLWGTPTGVHAPIKPITDETEDEEEEEVDWHLGLGQMSSMRSALKNPMRKLNAVSDLGNKGNNSSMTSGGNTNIYINEKIDLRGAYGITDKATAEKVYKEVWSPARRGVIGRFTNTRGKVIR